MFKGTATALITPFNKKGVDFESLDNLINFQIDNDIDGLVICGTTGEPATMTEAEKTEVINFAIQKVNHRVPVIVGTGSNCTEFAIEHSKQAEKAGADALLVVTPYYNKCTQEGLFRHYEAICSSVEIPVIAYNVPGRTGVNLLPATAQRLTEIPNLVGIKEACGKLEQIAETAKAIAGSQVELFSGDDNLATEIIKLGGQGLISVASNLLPREMHEMTTFALNGDFAKAVAMQEYFADLLHNLFTEVNPTPIKYACSLVGLCKNILRLPLLPMSIDASAELKFALKKINII